MISPQNSTKHSQGILGRVTSIRHVHEFYEEGDIWSEARRKRSSIREIPSEVARKYTTITIELLGTTAPDNPVPPALGTMSRFILEAYNIIFLTSSKEVGNATAFVCPGALEASVE